MSHFHTICHYDYITNIVINLVSFMKKAMQSRDNRMTVASKHFSHNKIDEHKEKKNPYQQNEGQKTLNPCFIVKLVLITTPDSG